MRKQPTAAMHEEFNLLRDMMDDYRHERRMVDNHFVMPQGRGEVADLMASSSRHARKAAAIMLRLEEFCENNDFDFRTVRENLTADLH